MAQLHLEVIGEPPEGWTIIDSIVLAKCLDETGEVSLWMSTSDGLKAWESWGMLASALDRERDGLASQWVADDE